MAAKKKTNKTQAKTKKPVGKKMRPMKKTAKRPSKRKAVSKAATRKKTTAKTKAVVRKTMAAKTKAVPKKPVRRESRIAGIEEFSLQSGISRSGARSGDLQGLPVLERADSESVGELLEEGNAFEADAVMGVQDAGDAEGKEVRTHEVPEDDVPGEYLDKD